MSQSQSQEPFNGGNHPPKTLITFNPFLVDRGFYLYFMFHIFISLILHLISIITKIVIIIIIEFTCKIIVIL